MAEGGWKAGDLTVQALQGSCNATEGWTRQDIMTTVQCSVETGEDSCTPWVPVPSIGSGCVLQDMPTY
jgi:hypothetical protein